MATYFHEAPEIQTDGLQTLYLMNPGFVQATPANMVYLNSSMNSLNPMGLPENPQSTNPQHLAGIPLQPTQDSGDPRSVHTSHHISAAQYQSPRIHYNPIDMSSLWRPIASSPPQQRLSLSLSPHQAPYGTDQRDVISPANDRELKVMGSSSSAINDGISGLQSALTGSKYLKAAQQLLDEVVSLWRGTKAVASKNPVKFNRESEAATEADSSMKRGTDLSTAEKQELQMKKAKLANMLDEVEQRYRQYRQQMQIVITSFESVAGFGSARTYTAIALQTISKQFRCLRDAISGQIRATSKSLGEEEGDTKSSGSRLRFVDHHLRQQRALQQLGMIQHSAWRPQRGLPERAVSVLRAWLFEHFLHPYPKDSDKHMLAKQTGLTRSQVSNWFINARVRLWKPMVEEMYMEESKDQGQTNDNETTSNIDAKEDSVSKSSANQDMISSRTEQTDSFDPNQNSPNEPKAPPIMIENHSAIAQSSFKKARSDEMSNRELLMEFMNGRSGESPEYHPLISSNTNRGGGFGAYSLGEIGRFDGDQFMPRFSGNGVSLTLGLPHSENLTLSGTQPSYLSSERIHTDPNDYSSFSNNQTASHPPNLYEGISIQNRKRFSGQLLPDYVA